MKKGMIWTMLVTLLATGQLLGQTSTSAPRTPAPARTVAVKSTDRGINRAWCAKLREARATIRASQSSPTEPTSSGKDKTVLGIVFIAIGVLVATLAIVVRWRLGINWTTECDDLDCVWCRPEPEVIASLTKEGQ